MSEFNFLPRIKKILLFLMLTLYLSKFAEAQITPEIGSNTDSGCIPLQVSFSNNTIGNGDLRYEWNFDNGNSSVIKTDKSSVSASFLTSGTYNISLKVKDGSSTYTARKTITVFEGPVANFSASALSGCQGIEIDFDDKSTEGDSPIKQWSWDFRDGGFAFKKEANHKFETPGIHDIYLIITDANGCSASKPIDDPIIIFQNPSVDFSFDKSYSCTYPATVIFTNQSTGTSKLIYDWDFGDKTSSKLENPQNKYRNPGTYNITLTATDEKNCSDTKNLLEFNLMDYKASFDIKKGETIIADGETSCPSEIKFINTSTGTNKAQWNFGDGNTTEAYNGKNTYTEKGKYTITLITSPESLCPDTLSKTITLEEVTARFEIDKDYSCSVPFDVHFTDKSINAQHLFWSFGNGTNLTDIKTPTVTYDIENSLYYGTKEPIEFEAKLIAQSQYGCTSDTTIKIKVNRPYANFLPDVVTGCIPLEITMSDFSRSLEPIVNWEWVFGDGTKANGKNHEVKHTYTKRGIYETFLVITNEDGCIDSSYTITIKTGKIADPNFKVIPDIVCANQEPQFFDLTPANDSIDTWHYTVKNNPTELNNACYWEKNPILDLGLDTGYIDVTLTVGNNGCFTDTTIQNAFYVKGATASFNYESDCKTPLVYQFDAEIVNADTWTWDFGDGITDESSKFSSLTHNYADSKDYNVVLTVFKDACEFSTENIIKSRNLKSDFDFFGTGCANSYILFDAENSENEVNECYEAFLWDFDDGSRNIRTLSKTTSHSFDKKGNYNVKLIAYDNNGCSDTIIKSVSAAKPKAAFETNETEGCIPLLINYTDKTTSEIPIKLWKWDFGDGNLASGITQSHTYRMLGNFDASLEVTDTLGCKDTAIVQIISSKADARFNISSSKKICIGDSILVQAFSPDNNNLIWNFGDATTVSTTEGDYYHKYTSTGEFYVSLKITNKNCIDSVKSTTPISVQDVDAKFTLADTIYNCYPASVNLYHKSEFPIKSGGWRFGHNNNTSVYLDTTRYIYSNPGKFLIELDITTSNGCRDATSQLITVKGPQATFNMADDAICLEDMAMFFVETSSEISQFEWDFGDGIRAFGDTVYHKYNNLGNYLPVLWLMSEPSEDNCPSAIYDSITIKKPIAKFSTDKNEICEYNSILFSDNTLNPTKIEWDFDDGTKSDLQISNHKFDAGNYNVGLIVWDDIGCTDTITKPIIIKPIPPINIGSDEIICLGTSIKISASGGDKILWSPAINLDNKNSYEPVAMPDTTTTYTATIENNTTSCKNSATIKVEVQQKPQIDFEPTNEATIIKGNSIQIEPVHKYASTFKWTPTHSLDCYDCSNPIASPDSTTDYTVMVSDPNDCFTVTENFRINVNPPYLFAIPNSFTPNDDNINDIISIKGYVNNLISFKIFNRWGQLVFETKDITEGWNGYLNKKLQPIGAYAYTIKFYTFDGKQISKKGYIHLLK